MVSNNTNAVKSSTSINLDSARRYLDMFGWPNTFQTFDDAGKGRRELVRIIHGKRFEDVSRFLERLNNDGAGIFLCVNQTDGNGRSAKNVTRVRALFVDADGTAAPQGFHKTPNIFVWRDAPQAEIERAGLPLCRWHAYWLTSEISLEQFGEYQKRLARYYHTDPAIFDLPRVMRIPGFIHRKAEPQEVYLERAE